MCVFFSQSFDITPIATSSNSITSTKESQGAAIESNELISITNDEETKPMEENGGSMAEASCDDNLTIVDDDLVTGDVTTVVYTATSFESEKFDDFTKQKFELERL